LALLSNRSSLQAGKPESRYTVLGWGVGPKSNDQMGPIQSIEIRELPEHRKFKCNGKILELRTVGQTVVPPSLHEDTGEEIVWHEAEGTPARVAGIELSRIAGELAAATLLLRQYPAVKAQRERHNLALALAGFLLRKGWNAEHICIFLHKIATQAGDEELQDRLTCVETTAERLAAGETALGGPSLRELIGSEVFQQFCNWLGFTTVARFALPTIEAETIEPEAVPLWPVDILEGDFLSELTYQLYVGTSLPPQYLREQMIAVLAALADGNLGYPLHRDLPARRFLAMLSEHAQAGKGESWKRIVGDTPEGGALRPLLGNLKLLNGSRIGSGQYLAKELEENPRACCHWDESSQLFQVSGQQGSTLFSALKSLFESTSHWTGSFTNKKHGGDDLHLSVLLHATRKTFVDGFALRGGMGDGLLSRFTLCYSGGMPVVPEWEPRNFAEERKWVATIANLIPQQRTVPTIAADARERMNAFARVVYSPEHSHFAHARRILELTKVDVLHRCVYSGSPEITREMVERSIAWGEHQLALRLVFWPSDATDRTEAMTKILLNRLQKGRATMRDLRTAAHVHHDGNHETLNRAITALKRSGAVAVVGKNRKGQEILALDEDEPQNGVPE